MDALGVLMEEHGIILYAINVLGEATARLKSGKDVPKKFHYDFLEIMGNFADRCHHGKEETVLFPLMETRDPNQNEVISLFLADHEKARAFLVGLKNAIAVNDKAEMIRNSEGYADLLKVHIQRENVLFPKWMNMLGDDDRSEVFEKFEEIEETIIGKGKHGEYASRIKRLSTSYANSTVIDN